jgi:hypothetical protein
MFVKWAPRKQRLFPYTTATDLKGVPLLVYPMDPHCRKSVYPWKVPRLRPFVLLVRKIHEWKGVCGIGEIILAGKNRSMRRKSCSSATSSTTNPT